MLLYLITNKIDGKRYIGQTIRTLDKRWKRHVYDSLQEECDFYLHRSIRKYGIENFEIKILSRCNSIEELNHREEYYIKLFNTLTPNGYNLLPGGKNKIPTQETRKKQSENRKGKKHSLEARANMGLAQKGRTFTPKTKAKMSMSHTGKILTQEHKNNISAVNKGKTLSLEHIDNISKANIGKIFTPEHCENLSKAHLGITFGDDRKIAMSKAQTGKKMKKETKEKLSFLNTGKGKSEKNIFKKLKTIKRVPHTAERNENIREAFWKSKSAQSRIDSLIKEGLKNAKAVFCHQNNQTYISIHEAAKDLGIHRPGINRSLKSGKSYRGYTFEYAKKEDKAS